MPGIHRRPALAPFGSRKVGKIYTPVQSSSQIFDLNAIAIRHVLHGSLNLWQEALKTRGHLAGVFSMTRVQCQLCTGLKLEAQTDAGIRGVKAQLSILDLE